MRTTLRISSVLLEELREIASRRKRPFREIVEETLQRGLAAGEMEGEKICLKTHAVGVKPAYQAMSLNQLYDQLEVEDLAGGRR